MTYDRKIYRNILKPLSKNKIHIYDFIGFDVETYGNDNKFYLGGLTFYNKYKEIEYKFFYDKIKMIEYILSSRFKGKYIVASNLGFDLTALFYDTKYWNDLNILESGSRLIYAEFKSKDYNKKGKIKFIDTMNYAPFSVEQLGNILNINKLDKPKFLGEKPISFNQETELRVYNKRDCEISMLFMYFLQRGFNDANGNLKITIASTSFDIWRRNFLKENLIKEEMRLKKDVREFIFNSYYGGRTEVYKKGKFKNLFYFDINSLYPSVMVKEFPKPQSVKEVSVLSEVYIKNYFGISECTIKSPNINKPLLPYRDKNNNKLIFPIGKFKGTWTNHELKKALELGYKILKIHKQIIYTETFYPFKDFVNYFYEKRKNLKLNNNPMEFVYKLVLNSLYGKFGQKKVKEFKVLDLDNFTGSHEELINIVGDDFIQKDNKIIISKEKDYNGKNVYPILASYVTSYARIKMYDYIKNDDVIYTDTDSVFISSNKYENSKELGKMKLEDTFKNGIFVKPKFYMVWNNDEDILIKIKGLSKANKEDFLNILENKSVEKLKFTKLKESVRRNLKPNSKIIIPKLFKLEDNKRVWKEVKGKDILISFPLKLNE